jgi:NADH-quinone oxidoreductase subunit A
MEYILVLLLIVLSTAFVLGGLIFSRLVAPHNPGPIKNTSYECGEQPIGHGWIQFKVGYYLFGLLFLAFDVEAAFLYPWAVAFREVGAAGFIAVALFVVVLLIGLAYAWKKDVLEWV